MAIANSRTRGLIDIPMASTPNCALKATSNLNLDASTTTQSAGNVYLGANPGNNTTTAYWRTQYDKNFIKQNTSNELTNSSTATINGTVQAGVDYLLDIEVNAAGNAISINGGTPINLNSNSTFVNQTIAPNSVTPAIPGQSFYPFQAAYNTNYTPNTSNGTDPATAAILSTSVSKSAVNALQLSGLVAQGGNVMVKAGTLAGTASLSAYTPSITITNPSANYLILDGVSILNGRNSGSISLLKMGEETSHKEALPLFPMQMSSQLPLLSSIKPIHLPWVREQPPARQFFWKAISTTQPVMSPSPTPWAPSSKSPQSKP